MSNGILVVISAPSGCGKDTIVNEIVKSDPGQYHISVSQTTRPMRSGEAEGINYYFVSREVFEENSYNCRYRCCDSGRSRWCVCRKTDA